MGIVESRQLTGKNNNNNKIKDQGAESIRMGIMRLLKETANGKCSNGMERVSVPFQRQGTPNNKQDEATGLKNEGEKTYKPRN